MFGEIATIPEFLPWRFVSGYLPRNLLMEGKAGNKAEYYRDQAGASKLNDPWELIIDNDTD